MMIGFAHVSVIHEPDVSNIKDFIPLLCEEFLEVSRWFNQIGEPDHGWQIGFLSLQEGTFELDRVGIGS
jgi:hypothetical protein